MSAEAKATLATQKMISMTPEVSNVYSMAYGKRNYDPNGIACLIGFSCRRNCGNGN